MTPDALSPCANPSPLAVMAAMDDELCRALPLPLLGAVRTVHFGGRAFHTGTLHDATVPVAQCGIGKVAAAATVALLAARFAADTRLAGGVAEAAAACLGGAFGEVERQAFGLPGAPRVHGELVVSGDRFVATAAKSAALQRALPVEREGAAAAQVCADFGLPFAVVRVVSDRAEGAAHVDFRRFHARGSERRHAGGGGRRGGGAGGCNVNGRRPARCTLPWPAARRGARTGRQ